MFHTDLLKGRTILITGGGTGLGRSMALRFAELGANIFLIARRTEPLKESCEAIREKGARAAYASADIRDSGAVEHALDAAEREFGRVDTLVNNAAGNFIARTESCRQMRSMLWSESFCTEHFSVLSRSARNGSPQGSPAPC